MNECDWKYEFINEYLHKYKANYENAWTTNSEYEYILFSGSQEDALPLNEPRADWVTRIYNDIAYWKLKIKLW